MQPSRIATYFLSSFLITDFFLQWWQQTAYPWSLWIIIAVVGCVSIGKRSVMIGAATIGIAFAVFTVARTTHVPSAQTIDGQADGYLTFHGMIAGEPERRGVSRRYVIEAENLVTESGSTLLRGRILVTDRGGWPLYAYGDTVTVSGTLEHPGVIEDFHEDRYLSVKGIYSVMRNGSFQADGDNHGNAFFRGLYSFKEFFERHITLMHPEPDASLLTGLLTGTRADMPQAVQDDFQSTGLTHLVAISGSNITMVITTLSVILFWLPLRWRFLPSVFLIICFTLFTGAGASVVRAAVMGILGLIALQTGRAPSSRLLVLWSAFFLLIVNPKQLWWDAGFQLSFLALIGLMEIMPLLEPWMTRVPERFGLRDSLTQTLSAQIMTTPLILINFGRASLVAPLSNLLAPPAVPWAMLLGFFSLCLGWIHPLLGRIAALPADLALEWILKTAQILAALPLASVNWNGAGPVTMVCCYALILRWIIRSRPSPDIPAHGDGPDLALIEGNAMGKGERIGNHHRPRT